MEPATSGNPQPEAKEKTLHHASSSSYGEVIDPTGDDGVAVNLNRVDDAIESIGWGKYQWQLAVTCGFGFLVDQVRILSSAHDRGFTLANNALRPLQMLLVSIALVTPQASMEFGPKYATLLPAAQYSGLLVGAVVLGLAADNFGRRAIWQLSIFGASIAALLVASSPNWDTLNWWIALTSFFAGGNC